MRDVEMEYRPLGRSGMSVSAVGIGTAEMSGVPREQVVEMVHAAIDGGVNYFDCPGPQPDVRDDIGVAFAGLRHRVHLATHLGSVAPTGEYEVSRDPALAERFFEDFLTRCRTDYTDVLFLHCCDFQSDLDRVLGPGGLLDLARRLVREGKARAIGFSGHTVPTTRQAVESGAIDVLMFPVNPAGHGVPGRNELLLSCRDRGVGVVAMKPYAGGKLLGPGRTLLMEAWALSTDGNVDAPPFEFEKRGGATPITTLHCLSYALAQPAVATAVPGCKSLAEVAAALSFLSASTADRDFSAILADFAEPVSGECVYCNHCMPCPAGIDVGATIRLLESAAWLDPKEVAAGYRALPASPADCSDCGLCAERCPFGVDAPAKILQAAARFASLAV